MEEPPAIQRLRDAGLITRFHDRLSEYQEYCPGEPLEEMNELPWLSYSLLKPSNVGGNSRPANDTYVMLDDNGSGYSYTTRPDNLAYDPAVGFHMNAPAAHIFTAYPDSKTWYFEVREGIGPYPGDFKKSFPSVDAAVDAALEYYFGDPRPMTSFDTFERSLRGLVWSPVFDWFKENWEWKFEDREVNFASIFTSDYWLARFEKPLNWLNACYIRIRYTDPFARKLYVHFLARHVSFKFDRRDHENRTTRNARFIRIRTTVKKSVSIDDLDNIARER